jgi:hypothetical protein
LTLQHQQQKKIYSVQPQVRMMAQTKKGFPPEKNEKHQGYEYLQDYLRII